MLILDGRRAAAHFLENIKKQAGDFKKKAGMPPGLAVFLIGDDEASSVYVRKKMQACEEWGFYSCKKTLPSTCSLQELKEKIKETSQDPRIHGILVQLPLPTTLDKSEVLRTIPSAFDVDGLTEFNQGLLWSGHKDATVPCTALGIVNLLKFYKLPLKGKHAVIVGRSSIVGMPTCQQLLAHNLTVTICHSHTKNLREETLRGDIVLACAGKKHLLSKQDFKKDAVVIDVGVHREKKGLAGDVDTEGVDTWLHALSPVPGGVGPMTIAMLLSNTLKLAERSVNE